MKQGKNRSKLYVFIVMIFLVLGLTACNQDIDNQATDNTENNHQNGNQDNDNQTEEEFIDQEIYPAEITRNGDQVNITMYTTQNKIEIAEGNFYQGWTFDGTVPGPVLRVNQGDKVTFTLVNKDPNMAHSMDFHAAQTPWDKNYIDLAPGESYTYDWEPNIPGTFMYHCGTPPVIAHIANGMYGTIIVDPIKSETQQVFEPAREFVLVQSEFYAGAHDVEDMINGEPQVVAFNGRANKYQDNPLEAKPGELIRIHVVNAGPNNFSAFHIVGAIFEKVYLNGNPNNVNEGVQTVTIPPGGSYVVELRVPEEGLYPMVSHSFKDAEKGAMGLLKITEDAKDQPLAP